MSLWIIGAGEMALGYAKVLRDLGQEYEVIGRSPESAIKFESRSGISVRQGGLETALSKDGAPDQAIVCVGIEQLAEIAKQLIIAGTQRILLEKPGGLNTAEIEAIHQLAKRKKSVVLIGYNRRFYASTSIIRKLILEDDGVTSCTFEFTEWSHIVASLATNSRVKENWFIANSTHVVDLVFHLCGLPQSWKTWHGGQLDWHPASARFCGSGITDRGVFFSYMADWNAPGRWGIEILTRKRRFILRPMEELHVTPLKSVVITKIDIEDQLDKQFKPGLYRQTEAFVNKDDTLFCDVEQQVRHCSIYDEMAGYDEGS